MSTGRAKIAYFYDFSCPYAYLASTQIEGFAARIGVDVEWRPMLLGGVFKAVGWGEGPNATLSIEKAKMNLFDMNRWAVNYGVPLLMPSSHPNRTVLALRATLAAGEIDRVRASKALFQAYWEHGRDVSDPVVVTRALDDAGLDGATLVSRAEEPSIKQALRDATDEAVEKGIFGAPSFVLERAEHAPELYFGQDRLDMLAWAVTGKKPAPIEPSSTPRDFEFFFDFSSPFGYLASTQVEAIAARHGAKLLYRPFLLGALFRDLGVANAPLLEWPEAKRAYTLVDFQRWAKLYGVQGRFPSRFPMNTVKALRMTLELPEEERAPLVNAIYPAYWAHDLDISQDEVLVGLANSVGLDGKALVAKTTEESAKARLKTATEEAKTLGFFGVPTLRVNHNVWFWGQDRLVFVEKALAGLPPFS